MNFWLPQPWDLVIAVEGSVLLALMAAFLLPQTALKSTWQDLDTQIYDSKALDLGIVLLTFLGLLTLGIYFTYVPFTCTGFYGYAFYPEAGPLLREYSLKLLNAPIATYAYSFYTSFISGLLFLFLIAKAQMLISQRRYILFIICVAAMLSVAFLGCMEGASYRYLTYGLLFLLFIIWRSRLSLRLMHALWILLVGGLLLGLQMLISLSGNPQATPERRALIHNLVETCAAKIPLKPVSGDPDWEEKMLGFKAHKKIDSDNSLLALPEGSWKNRFAEAWQNGGLQFPSIGNRIFVVPFRVGSWYYHYAQTNEPIGVAGIPRLARLMDLEPIAIGNHIGLIYGPDYYGREVVPIINASAGFLFTLYAFFGKAGVVIIFSLILLLDLVALLIVRLEPPLNAILLTFLTVIALNAVQADIGYLLYSGGLLPAVLILLFLHLTVWGIDRYRGRRNPGAL